jgi:hypothetical protein
VSSYTLGISRERFLYPAIASFGSHDAVQDERVFGLSLRRKIFRSAKKLTTEILLLKMALRSPLSISSALTSRRLAGNAFIRPAKRVVQLFAELPEYRIRRMWDARKGDLMMQ